MANNKKEAVDIRLVPTKLIVENESFKWKLDEKQFKFLVKKIGELGLFQPLKVCSLPNGKFMTLEDNYDLRALRTLGVSECQIVVCDELKEKDGNGQKKV